MENHESRSHAKLVASIVLLVVIGASLIAAAYLRIGQSSINASSTATYTSTYAGVGVTSSFQTLGSTSTQDEALGLRLSLHISANATGALSISTNETNLLNKVNNVTAANDWPYPNTNSNPCGNYDQIPTEFAVLQGHYDMSNYTSASSLTLYDPGDFYSCPTEVFPGPYLLFAPLSDNVSRSYSSGYESSFLASASYSVTGYWTGSGNTASFHQFSPGIYTVLAEDEWGNVVLLPFTVGNAISITGLSLCPSNCVYPAPYVSHWSLINGKRSNSFSNGICQQHV